MYCEYTPEHFKIYAPCEEFNTFVAVYARNKDINNKDTTYIFDGLREMYESQWMDPYAAAVRARAVVKDFFTVCQKLSNMQQWPFALRMSVLDLTLYNHGKQLPVHWRGPDEGQLWQWDQTVQRDSEDQQLLNDWLSDPKVWKSKGNKQLSKNRRRSNSK
jgi:hypothetical protein